MKFIDLFAGVGGFRLGLERAGHECVWSNEFDKYAAITYVKNFGGDNFDTRDIREISGEEIPEHDLLCGGFPCQSFSIAGKRKGLEEERGTLFDEIVRIARAKRPKMLLLENVKGLLSAQNGFSFFYILSKLDELGYDVEWQVLNSKYFGVPQNRERIFIIGHLRGTSTKKIFPLREDAKKVSGVSEIKVIGTTKSETANGTNFRSWVHDPRGIVGALSATSYKEPTKILTLDRKDWREHQTPDETPTLKQRMGTGGHNVPMVIGSTQKNAGVMKDCSTCLGEAMGKGGGHIPMVTRVPLKFLTRNQKNIEGDYAFTVDGANTGGVFQNKLRRLTPLECERLQGFPNNWTEGVSDTQRYKQMGNAVTVNVIKYLGGMIK